MNRSIIRLFGVVILLFTVLIVWTSRWTVFDATALQNNSLNRLEFFATEKIKRGRIIADNGAVLAESVRAGGGTWTRRYPYGSLFAQAVGYNVLSQSQRAGLEWSRASELLGKPTGLTSVFGSFNGGPKVGDQVDSTLDPKAQRLARSLLAGRVGSVVAIVPQTGAVKVMYSNPTYNDNDLKAHCPPNPEVIGCQFNYATQAGLPPGSTFKLITTTAALDSGRYTPSSIFNGDSPVIVSGHSLENDSNYSYGPVTLTKALTDSINTVYAPLGVKLGGSLMQEYMQRFGFYSVPPLDYPANQMIKSGERFYPGVCGRHKNILLLPVTNSCVDLGRTAIGQANLTVTPMQMAMVVSAIANDGKLMEPRLTSKVVNTDGQVVDSVPPQEYDQVMKPKIAAELRQMMRDVVEEGTGTAANLNGLNIGGKTGTASTGLYKNGQELDDAWFVGFPESNPKIAVAVELTNIPNGYGGTYAAPIAAQVIKTLLAEKQ
ncbi:MAG TPA: penicillin-binding protein 2 [Solirubrobacteraceae bacterium]|nr:penicillin-binding protein 2 [Solirubrobacteraceae bacterium]